jgi:hypothetical protein
VFRLVTGEPPAPAPAPPHMVRCAFDKCRAVNPDGARFCRRCGKMFTSASGHPHPAAKRAAAARQAAMW